MMRELLTSDLALLVLTIGVYSLGVSIYRRCKIVLLHPVLLTLAVTIFTLRYFGVDYQQYKEATSLLSYGLNMSVVALGYLLYEQFENIKQYLLQIIISTVVGSSIALLSVIYIAKMFGAGHDLITSIAPKSVTLPIAIGIIEPLGGVTIITTVVVFCVGIFGSMVGPYVLQRVGITDARAKGFALGAAAHGIGTARAIELGALEGAMSGLAMALMGFATAILLPIFERLLY